MRSKNILLIKYLPLNFRTNYVCFVLLIIKTLDTTSELNASPVCVTTETALSSDCTKADANSVVTKIYIKSEVINEKSEVFDELTIDECIASDTQPDNVYSDSVNTIQFIQKSSKFVETQLRLMSSVINRRIDYAGINRMRQTGQSLARDLRRMAAQETTDFQRKLKIIEKRRKCQKIIQFHFDHCFSAVSECRRRLYTLESSDDSDAAHTKHSEKVVKTQAFIDDNDHSSGEKVIKQQQYIGDKTKKQLPKNREKVVKTETFIDDNRGSFEKVIKHEHYTGDNQSRDKTKKKSSAEKRRDSELVVKSENIVIKDSVSVDTGVRKSGEKVSKDVVDIDIDRDLRLKVITKQEFIDTDTIYNQNKEKEIVFKDTGYVKPNDDRSRERVVKHEAVEIDSNTGGCVK